MTDHLESKEQLAKLLRSPDPHRRIVAAELQHIDAACVVIETHIVQSVGGTPNGLSREIAELVADYGARLASAAQAIRSERITA
ncbi:MAG: hypothetical protein JWL82_128 [Parcubacteria group bacterium]|nr:hypothetical protein [Parcubacteria group bacterium]